MKNIFKKIKNKFQRVGTAVKNATAKTTRVITAPFRKIAKTKAMQFVGKCMQPFIKVLKIPIVGHLVLACVMNILLESLSRHSLIKAIVFFAESPKVFFYNAFIIFVTLSLVLFAKRTVFATIFVCAVWIISAFANYTKCNDNAG